jgi:hypothetical protein
MHELIASLDEFPRAEHNSIGSQLTPNFARASTRGRSRTQKGLFAWLGSGSATTPARRQRDAGRRHRFRYDFHAREKQNRKRIAYPATVANSVCRAQTDVFEDFHLPDGG